MLENTSDRKFYVYSINLPVHNNDKQMSETCVSLWFLFQIPKYIRKGKDIQVVIEKKHIQVSHKDETGSTVE
jgi:hypothetical protein